MQTQLNAMSDDALAILARDGDVEAWEVLYPRIVRMAQPILRRAQRMHQEDLIQDALVRFWRALPSYSIHRGSVRVFVATIARRTLLDFYRSQGRQPSFVDVEGLLDTIEATYPVEHNPRPDLMRFLRERLEEQDVEIVCLRLFEGYPHSEIASKLGLTPGNVRVRCHRAIEKLRQGQRKT